VKRIGKPFKDVYDTALQNLHCDMSKVCMIGDALETDVVGGTTVGIDTIWVVNNGVHSIDIKNMCSDDDLLTSSTQVVHTFNSNTTGTYAHGLSLKPTMVMPSFKW
jgi:ribonucleotide monophosphatase NagD (HAD superfamily)